MAELYVYLREAHLANAALTAVMLIWQSHPDPFVRDMLRGGPEHAHANVMAPRELTGRCERARRRARARVWS